MWRTDSLEKTLILGKIEGKRRRGRQRMRQLDGITDSWTWVWASSESWWWTDREAWCAAVVGLQKIGHDIVTELNSTLVQCSFSVVLCVKSLQSCPTFCSPVDYRLPGSFVHGILQARIEECVAMPSSRGSFPPRDPVCFSYVSWFRCFFTTSTSSLFIMDVLFISYCQVVFHCKYLRFISFILSVSKFWDYPFL